MHNAVIHGDALEVLKTLPSDSVHALCCDPPAGIGFMNKAFDSDRGGRDKWVAWLRDIMIEAKRVLCAGGHGLIWSLPRTSHWTALALEDAGFEIRDTVYHLYAPDSKVASFYSTLSQEQRNLFEQVLDSQDTHQNILHVFGSGFPKSTNISKQIDKLYNAQREVVGPGQWANRGRGIDGATFKHVSSTIEGRDITAPATEDAKKWDGWQTSLKPAVENWILVRKPLAEKSITAQVLANGCGGLNIDASRVGTSEYTGRPSGQSMNAYEWSNKPNPMYGQITGGNPQGRFPSHLLLSHSVFCVPLGVKKGRANGGENGNALSKTHGATYDLGIKQRSSVTYRDADGLEQVEAYDCAPERPIFQLDQQSGVRNSHGDSSKATYGGMFGNGKPVTSTSSPNDQGGASRYFQNFPPDPLSAPPFYYAAKSSRRERNLGLEGMPEKTVTDADKWAVNDRRSGTARQPTEWKPAPQGNHHPTVKSLALMKYLCTLITPPNGIVLDPFFGSGSTGVACIQSGFHFIGIEQSLEYVQIAQARIQHALRLRDAGRTPARREDVEYSCAPECPVRILGEQSGVSKSTSTTRHNKAHTPNAYAAFNNPRVTGGHDDTGTAARYFQTFPPDSLFPSKDQEAV